MLAPRRVRIFIKMSPIKLCQGMRILGKMTWHPVENDTDTRLMTTIHKATEISQDAMSAGWSEIARRLITPRSIQRMLGNRHQLDMSETQRNHVSDQSSRQFLIA